MGKKRLIQVVDLYEILDDMPKIILFLPDDKEDKTVHKTFTAIDFDDLKERLREL